MKQVNPTDKRYMPYIPADNTNRTIGPGEWEERPIEVLNYWEDKDQTGSVWLEMPETTQLKSRETPGRYGSTEKVATVQNPIHARPVITKAFGGEFNAVSTRLGSTVTFRKHKLNIKEEVREFGAAYFRPEREEMAEKYRKDAITWNSSAIRTWLTMRTGVAAIDKELDQIEAEGLDIHRINHLKVHQKLETLIKTSMILVPMYMNRTRIIVWQQKGITALFADAFLRAKSRLKELMSEKILYADGHTPDELSARLR
jgi:hypothetical protein